MLLDEAGVKPHPKWAVADGADSAMMSRAFPYLSCTTMQSLLSIKMANLSAHLTAIRFDYFSRGLGKGNMSVKWLRSIKVTSMPAMTKDETSKYSDLRDDGYADLFFLPDGS
ncbi:MAG: hypothetical protein CM1200mP24_10380 [Gammaproteobacteria bacterium]|nr:MAG: hypothetical protein CM1200mP24_10380 [Gammaproteobacteria bacterium]